MSVKQGDLVFLEEAWEDAAGNFHDEYVRVARVKSNGTFTVRIGHWKTRTHNQTKLQAYLNGFDWYVDDYEPEKEESNE